MSWIKYDIKTTTDAEDIISACLYENGITSVEIKDKVPVPPEQLDGMFTEILPDEPVDDGLAVVSFYIDEDDTQAEELKKRAEDALDELRTVYMLPDIAVEKSILDNTDWAHNWKKYWHTLQINDLFIKPSWEAETPEMKVNKVLSLDPGTAFGTGGHETTKLCIKAIQKFLSEGDKVLDIGCGSGILSVVAMLYGAGECLGTDLDKLAISASEENARANLESTENVTFALGNIVSDKKFKAECGLDHFDFVLANILPDVLVPLSEDVDQNMKSGAYLIYSGILLEKEDEVKKALEKNENLYIIDTLYEGEWLAIIARKK